MKKIISICLLGLLTASVSSAQYTNDYIKAGQEAPELSYPSPDGKTLSLKEINKGRYVLLDFWASWCGPCRMANPALVKFYKKYKDKKFKNAPNGFTIVSVSLDKSKTNWVNAIKADHLSWPYHMSDLQAWSSDAAAKYGVRFIPQSFLIGPDGKIIDVYGPDNDPSNAEKVLDKAAQ